MTEQQVVQIHTFLPNPVKDLSGYPPVTSYWVDIIHLANAMILTSAGHGHNAKRLQEGANFTIGQQIFKDTPHTPAEWAEFVMGLNHILWFIHDMYESRGIEYLEPVVEALTEMYYEWHDKALGTLKGDGLSEYLRITD